MNKEKQFRTALNLIMLFVLMIATPVFVSGQQEPEERPKASGGCSDLTGTTWTVEPKMVIGTRKRPEDRLFSFELTNKTSRFAKDNSKPKSYMAQAIPDSPKINSGWWRLLDGNVLRLSFTLKDAGEYYHFIYKCKLDANCQANLPSGDCQLDIYDMDGNWKGTVLDITFERQQKE